MLAEGLETTRQYLAHNPVFIGFDTLSRLDCLHATMLRHDFDDNADRLEEVDISGLAVLFTQVVFSLRRLEP